MPGHIPDAHRPVMPAGNQKLWRYESDVGVLEALAVWDSRPLGEQAAGGEVEEQQRAIFLRAAGGRHCQGFAVRRKSEPSEPLVTLSDRPVEAADLLAG